MVESNFDAIMVFEMVTSIPGLMKIHVRHQKNQQPIYNMTTHFFDWSQHQLTESFIPIT